MKSLLGYTSKMNEHLDLSWKLVAAQIILNVLAPECVDCFRFILRW